MADLQLHPTRSVRVLRRVARLLDRSRAVPMRIGYAVDKLDRKLGDACWWLRFKADKIERPEIDDGIPF